MWLGSVLGTGDQQGTRQTGSGPWKAYILVERMGNSKFGGGVN